jgi:hypothetical protein
MAPVPACQRYASDVTRQSYGVVSRQAVVTETLSDAETRSRGGIKGRYSGSWKTFSAFSTEGNLTTDTK